MKQSGCFLKNKVKPLSLLQIYQRVEEYLLQLVRVVNPQKFIFIGFDGVAPRAKINQSRDRRFRSGIQDIQFFEQIMRDINIQDKQHFQANSISPGTQFLYNLCQNLKVKVQHLLESQWKGLHVLYSDCCVPGQGQHKIMDFLRYAKQIDLFTTSTTHCVYSPDADVILLTLALDIEYISVIKQDTTQLPSMNWTATSTYRKLGPPQFQFVFINILRQYFQAQFKQQLKIVSNCTIQQIIDDFVLLMAFIGNDFLPTQFCFKLTDQHMDALLDSYRKYLVQHKTFINNRGIIDWKKITALLGLAKHFQANRISELKVRFKQRRQQKKEQGTVFDEEEEKQDVENSQIQKFEVQDNRIVEGIGNYYKSRFNISNNIHNLGFVKIVKKYIEGLDFYCKYYYQGLPSWNWYYPYHYSPLLTDVYDYLSTHSNEVQLQKGQPFDPILALCFMLPEQNFGLLPPPISSALKDPKCKLRSPHDYFPAKFQLDKFQQLKYNKRALILFLNQAEVRSVYQSIPKETLTKQQRQRNSQQKAVLFYPNKDRFGLTFVSLEPWYSKELKDVFQNKYSKVNQTSSKRFPSLTLLSPKLQLNIDGKIQCSHKYKFTNPLEMVFFNNFIGYVEGIQPLTPSVLDQIRIQYNKKAGIAYQGQCKACYVVKRARFVRQTERDQVITTRRQILVPDFALFKAPNLDYLPKVQRIQPKQRYQLRERVVILSEKYFGCKGLIEQLGQKEVKVRLIQDPIKSESRIEQMQQAFFTIDYVTKELDISKNTLFSIISEVILLPIMKKKQWNQRLPTSLNFGLNFIDIPNAKIVPRFVRINFVYQNTKVPQTMFDHLEFSRTALTLLQKYIATFNWLVELLQQWKSNKLRKEFKAKNVFGREKDPNTKLYKEFIKLYHLDTKGTFCSFYSKTADLTNLPKMYTEKKSQKAMVTLGYHQITSLSLARKSPPALKYQPEYHDIGSRVILLQSLQIGYVVCIDDFYLHVIVGKEKRRIRVKFTQAFNESWSSSLSKEPGKCWDLQVGYYQPTYWKAAIGA